ADAGAIVHIIQCQPDRRDGRIVRHYQLVHQARCAVGRLVGLRVRKDANVGLNKKEILVARGGHGDLLVEGDLEIGRGLKATKGVNLRLARLRIAVDANAGSLVIPGASHSPAGDKIARRVDNVNEAVTAAFAADNEAAGAEIQVHWLAEEREHVEIV